MPRQSVVSGARLWLSGALSLALCFWLSLSHSASLSKTLSEPLSAGKGGRPISDSGQREKQKEQTRQLWGGWGNRWRERKERKESRVQDLAMPGLLFPPGRYDEGTVELPERAAGRPTGNREGLANERAGAGNNKATGDKEEYRLDQQRGLADGKQRQLTRAATGLVAEALLAPVIASRGDAMYRMRRRHSARILGLAPDHYRESRPVKRRGRDAPLSD
ncbi:hypothetical protein CDD81_3876 [Ophiocordyceps australis]|uniref:Transmembrane protein n=1 Tax=Ophiocordyceps australis TaxID=1399860 RepID=A0A2C5YBH5_9HYPO|nr:hypothetical protein CDD81_3876 [Ophiocordyceps australis]